MCGILAILAGPKCPRITDVQTSTAESLLHRLEHRGPDGFGIRASRFAWLGHRRLAVMDPASGQQPFVDQEIAWIANGEIFNHWDLRERLRLVCQSSSDCAVIGPAWRRFGERLPEQLDGQFALVTVDEQTGHWMAARDHVGICPLFIGRHRDGTIWFASEMKSLVDECDEVRAVEPGTAWYFDGKSVSELTWYQPTWKSGPSAPSMIPDHGQLRRLMIDAVEKRLPCDAPFGFLLSGGLDSSLITAIGVELLEQKFQRPRHEIDTFSIGLQGAPDLLPARRAAEFLGTRHHEFHFTLEEALEAVPTVAWHMETVEQVRTAVPTYLLAKRIKQLGFKMVLSGEGADEMFGGYLYFYRAPSPQAFFEETVRKVTRLYQFDVARADRAPMGNGVEVRFPFLDKRLLDYVMGLDPRTKMPLPRESGGSPIEKQVLRMAFDPSVAGRAYLPEEILWRQKEQFSDGVGYDWVDCLREHSARRLSQTAWRERSVRFPVATPATAEQYWMRELFEEHFVTGTVGGRSAAAGLPDGRSIACSTPEATNWDPAWKHLAGDISGRAIAGVHTAESSSLLRQPRAAELPTTVAVSDVPVER